MVTPRVMTRPNVAAYVIVIFSLICTLDPANAALTASVDRTKISESDILSLTIRSTQGSVEDKLDFSALGRDFEILNTQRSSQISIVNGARSANYDLTLVLAPKRVGTLQIPAFRANGEESMPIMISVTAGNIDPKKELARVFLESEVSTPQAYVQEQILYTLKLYHAVGLEDASISPLDVENAITKTLGDQRKYETILEGIRYSVIEIRYAIFPQRSGNIEIPPQLFNGRTASQFLGFRPYDSRVVRSRSAPHLIDVLPKPPSYPNDQPWLPTRGIDIIDSWSEKIPEFQVGEPVTRTIEINGRGLTAAQLPNINLSASEGVKIYPDQSQTDDLITEDGIVGQISFATAFVPNREGNVTLPGFSVTWWNTQRDRLETSEIPAATIRVLPASASSAVPPVPLLPSPITLDTTPLTNNLGLANRFAGVWPFITGIMTLLWLTTLWLWRRSIGHKQRAIRDSQEPSTSQAYFTDLRSACRQGDPIAARQAFLQWVDSQVPDRRITMMQEARGLVEDESLEDALTKLEEQLYAQGDTKHTWSGKELLAGATRIKKSLGKLREEGRPGEALQPLYPL